MKHPINIGLARLRIVAELGEDSIVWESDDCIDAAGRLDYRIRVADSAATAYLATGGFTTMHPLRDLAEKIERECRPDPSIEWCDRSWNVTRGCRRVSPGCQGCYAERLALRFSGTGLPYEGLVRRNPSGEPRWTGAGRFVREKLAEPLKIKKPSKIFVNSTSDLFFEEFADEEIGAVFAIMAATPRHTYMVLTKRAQLMRDWFTKLDFECIETRSDRRDVLASWAANELGDGSDGDQRRWFWKIRDLIDGMKWPLPNVWLGVSVEDQLRADERLPILLRTPAAVRFVSAEPLLGPVDLRIAAGDAYPFPITDGAQRGRIDWVICGGESGPGARPMDPAWAWALRYQCLGSGAAFFMKQMGTVAAGRGKGGKLDDIPAGLRIREFPR